MNVAHSLFKRKVMLVMILFLLSVISFGTLHQPTSAQSTPVLSVKAFHEKKTNVQDDTTNVKIATQSFCGWLSSYTTWHDGKRTLFIWSGDSNHPPMHMSVYYKDNYVSPGQKSVEYRFPQINLNNGWWGYNISKTWAFKHWGWDNDSNWGVRGCNP